MSETLDGGVLNLVETPEGTGIGLTPPEDGPLTDGSQGVRGPGGRETRGV